MKLTRTFLKYFLILILIYVDCDLGTPSESELDTQEINPPTIKAIYKNKSSINVGDIVNLSVEAIDPQGLQLYYMWTFDATNGENFVAGKFLGSQQSQQVSWQADEIWFNNAPNKNYGIVKLIIDVHNMYKTTTSYALVTVYK